jgi:hypothetical protein
MPLLLTVNGGLQFFAAVVGIDAAAVGVVEAVGIAFAIVGAVGFPVGAGLLLDAIGKSEAANVGMLGGEAAGGGVMLVALIALDVVELGAFAAPCVVAPVRGKTMSKTVTIAPIASRPTAPPATIKTVA